MIQKKKPCKGTGQAKGYGCGKPTLHRIYGLGKMCCYPDWLLNSEAGQLKLQKATLKATKPRRDLEKAQKERKNRHKITTLIEAVKTVCHTYIKKRDHGKPCISCGTPYHADFQAGHFYKAELFSTLKFHEDNIHGQCQRCNLRLEGNLNDYELRLPGRIGEEAFRALQQLARSDKKQRFKWDREELTKTRTYYHQKIKNL